MGLLVIGCWLGGDFTAVGGVYGYGTGKSEERGLGGSRVG